MIGLGTIINCAAIVVGGVLGHFIGKAAYYLLGDEKPYKGLPSHRKALIVGCAYHRQTVFSLTQPKQQHAYRETRKNIF